MRALFPKPIVAVPKRFSAGETPERTLRQLEPFERLAEASRYLHGSSISSFRDGAIIYQLRRFVFRAPAGGGDTMRVALFASLEGDATEGTEALVSFLEQCESRPLTVQGFELHVFPVCNLTGAEGQTALTRSGISLVEEFWHGSSLPEVYYLERELGVWHFQGVITLHSSERVGGLRAHTKSNLLQEALVSPALKAADKLLPDSLEETKVASKWVPAAKITETEDLSPAPFEITIDLPRRGLREARGKATVTALLSLLDSYRTLQSHRSSI